MKRERESPEQGVEDTPLLNLHRDLRPLIENDAEAQDLVRPYEDLSFLRTRLYSKSRLFRRAPHILDEATAAFDTDKDEDILKVLDSLSTAREEFMPKGNPVSTILSVITTGRELQRIRDSISSMPDEARRQAFMTYNVLSTLDMRNTATEIPSEELLLTHQVGNYLIHLTSELGRRTNDPEIQLDTGVLEYFSRIVMNRLVTREYLRLLPGDDVDIPSQEQVIADSSNIEALFQEMRQTRRFGMKMGYIHDQRGGSLVFGSIDNLSFAPGLDTHRLIQEMYHVSEAIVVHSEKRNFKNIRIKTKDLGSSDSVRTSTIDLSDLNAINDLHLGKDGNLYNDATCKDSLLPTAIELGKYTAYRDLQATVLSHYFDLTHPFEDVASIKKAEKSSALAATRTSSEPTEMIAKLLIPRVRYRAEDEAQNEDEESENNETEQARRTVRYHGVTWHIRKLPEGWSPSPAALQLAKDINVTLLPGETIVKEHTRGSRLLGEVVGHKLINRA